MLVLCFILGICAGCKSIPAVDAPAIRAGLGQVNRADGINGEEAMILAQNYMLDHGYDFDWAVNSARLRGEDKVQNIWTVDFQPWENGSGSGRRPKNQILLEHLIPFYVHINKTDGAIHVTRIQSQRRSMMNQE